MLKINEHALVFIFVDIYPFLELLWLLHHTEYYPEHLVDCSGHSVNPSIRVTPVISDATLIVLAPAVYYRPRSVLISINPKTHINS